MTYQPIRLQDSVDTSGNYTCVICSNQYYHHQESPYSTALTTIHMCPECLEHLRGIIHRDKILKPLL